jgi:nickel-dependent lactate racemase
VITSNSGYPLDLNVYQTVKGMSAAAQVVKTGGNIIMAAECWDGIPAGSDYESILKSVSSVNDLMTFITEKEKSIKDTWQIYFQAQIQKKANVFLYSDKLDEETIKMTLLNPVKDISGLVRNLVSKIGTKAEICILPEGPQTIPYFE